MATVPVPKTWVCGESPNYTDLRIELYETLYFLYNPPRVHVYQTTQQSMANNTWVSMNFQEVINDTEEMHSAANPSRLTPKTPGWYEGFWGGSWDVNTNVSGMRSGRIIKNGSTVNDGWRHDSRNHANTGYHKVLRGLEFRASFNGTTDYIQLQLRQTSGTTLNTRVSNDDARPELLLRWMGPL